MGQIQNGGADNEGQVHQTIQRLDPRTGDLLMMNQLLCLLSLLLVTVQIHGGWELANGRRGP